VNLPENLRRVLILALVFSAVFLAVFLTILATQSAYSMPMSQAVTINDGLDFNLGPPPNATKVPLDTAITVDALATAALNDLQVTPHVSIARVTSTTTGPLTYVSVFYPAELLKPSTMYNVSVTVMNSPVSWIFTTTNEPFTPSMSVYIATNVVSISLSTAAAATVVAGLAIWFRRNAESEHQTLD
jgi:hypothetical protein